MGVHTVTHYVETSCGAPVGERHEWTVTASVYLADRRDPHDRDRIDEWLTATRCDVSMDAADFFALATDIDPDELADEVIQRVLDGGEDHPSIARADDAYDRRKDREQEERRASMSSDGYDGERIPAVD